MQDRLAISTIIRCVLKPHHSLLRAEVARAAELTGSVIVEQRPPLCHTLLPLFRLFQEFRRDLEDHLETQETHLYPRLLDLEIALHTGDRTGSSAGEVAESLRLLKYGQASLTSLLEEMRTLTHGFAAPPDACECYGELLDVFAAIQMEVASEVRMESSMLFEEAEELLDRARCSSPREYAANADGFQLIHVA